MKVILELPDSTTSLGLFINISNDAGTITTTNWLSAPEDGMTISVRPTDKADMIASPHYTTTERKD